MAMPIPICRTSTKTTARTATATFREHCVATPEPFANDSVQHIMYHRHLGTALGR
jgi:hypothetical protein